MKKKILIIVLIGISLNVKAQNTFPPSGNAGIETTNPNATLQVGDSDNTGAPSSEVEKKRLSLAPVTHSGSDWFFTTRDNNPYANLDIGYSNNKTLTLRHDGNIGIGTANPEGELHINDNGTRAELIMTGNYSGGTTDINSIKFQYGQRGGNINGKSIASITVYNTTNTNVSGGEIRFNTKPTGTTSTSSIPNHRMIIKSNGNVGIGTTTPGTWKLAVNGNIRAKEIKVETGWSDFVFFKDYKLPTLKEVESHIKEKGHLKNIPSAKEVKENGILLGEMDSKLLQKIEELTLYTIQQQKEIDELKLQNKKLLELQKRLEKLEKSK